MFKQSVIASIIFISFSCGQNTHESVSSSDTLVRDSASSGIVQSAPDSAVQPTETHTAYNNEVTTLPASVALFVPKGYAVLDTASGNLNLDAYTDMILVLKNKEEESADAAGDPVKRPLLILLGKENNTYALAAESDNVVSCVTCGGTMGDPFKDVVIKNGYFSVEHEGGAGWRWTRTITFKYAPDANNWFLDKDGGDTYHAGDPDHVKTEIKTTKDFGKVAFESFDVYQ